MKKLSVLAAIAVLLGCNKAPDGPKDAPKQQKQIAVLRQDADNRPVVICFGDSLTAGMGLDPGQAYPEVMARDLPQYQVMNMGINGDTTQDGLERAGLATAQKPAVIVLELGANDGLRGFPIATTKENLRQMILKFQAAGARVILAGITLPPNYGRDYIASFEAVYQSLAKEYKLTLIPFLLEGVAGHADLMQKDGLHPTTGGTKIVADTVRKALTAP